MVVGTVRISLFLPENYSLKDKRQDVKSLLARVSNQFHVAAAEVADNDNWQRATIGIACVSTDARHANEILSRVVRFVEGNLQEGGLEEVGVPPMDGESPRRRTRRGLLVFGRRATSRRHAPPRARTPLPRPRHRPAPPNARGGST